MLTTIALEQQPWFTTSDPSGVPQVPTPEGAEMGRHLVRLLETAPEIPGVECCHDCAFREGTPPNQMGGTLLDALKCICEGVPFYCHVEDKPCAGYLRARAACAQPEAV